MKKFFYCACGISAVIVAGCAIYIAINSMSGPETFNVEVNGRNGTTTYTIHGNVSPDEVSSYVEEITNSLNSNKKTRW